MSTALTTIELNPELKALILADGVDNSALSAGIAESFPVISFRGKVWRVRFAGEATPILMEGDPVPAILCVIVQANPLLSKLYYAGAYEEGSADAPTCFSLDGITPDQTAEAPQSKTCAGCPHNVWGSKITPQGTKTKACSDSRRLAIVPFPDLANEKYGGPMLLRVPPASFKELVRYSKHLSDIGGQFSAVVTRIGFDLEAAFPKLVMREVRGLTIEEYKQVVEMRSLDTVGRMLSASEQDIADIAPDPGATESAAPSKEIAKAAPPPKGVDMAKLAQEAAEDRNEVDDDEAEAEAEMAALKAKIKKAKAAKAKAAKVAKARTVEEMQAATEKEEPPTTTEAAAATGVEIPADLADMLKEFNT